MARYGMIIDTTRCVGCFACRIACQMNNALSTQEAFIRYETIEQGVYPHVRAEQVPIQCQHCEDASCVRVCPTGASYVNKDGVVLVNAERCIGCRYCIVACPYHVRLVHEDTGEVDKCRFCVLKDNGAEPRPACVDTCVTQARIFGDLDDPTSAISKALVASNAKPLAGNLTKTKIFYVR